MEKPTMKQRVDSFKTFLWDSENGKVLGRGGRSWAEIGLFYLIYYACLAAFFSATVAVFYQTIKDTEPKLQGESSLLKGNPGMGFRPMPDVEDISIQAKKVKGKNKDYVDDLTDFLKPYRKADLKTINCGGLTEPRNKDTDTTACKVDLSVIDTHCKKSEDYGMSEGTPCVLIKMNKVFGWQPDLWDNANDSSLPKDLHKDYTPSVVPVKCYAKDKEDRDDLGTIDYYPQQGFPVYYFPYKNQEDYRAPLVFAKFANATVGKGFEIICRLYAKNINFDSTENEGGTKFDLKIVK